MAIPDTMAGSTAKRESQVSQEMSGLDKECTLLSEIIDRLAVKLSPVTRVSPDEKKEGLTRPQRVPLAENIAAMSERIAMSRERLTDLIDRCEL